MTRAIIIAVVLSSLLFSAAVPAQESGRSPATVKVRIPAKSVVVLELQ